MISFTQDTYRTVGPGCEAIGPGMKSSIRKLAVDKCDVV